MVDQGGNTQTAGAASKDDQVFPATSEDTVSAFQPLHAIPSTPTEEEVRAYRDLVSLARTANRLLATPGGWLGLLLSICSGLYGAGITWVLTDSLSSYLRVPIATLVGGIAGLGVFAFLKGLRKQSGELAARARVAEKFADRYFRHWTAGEELTDDVAAGFKERLPHLRSESFTQSMYLQDPEALANRYVEKLVELNLENLAAYYELVKGQTHKSFYATISVAIVGISLLFWGVHKGFELDEGKQNIALLTAGSGLITEFVATIFFYVYNRTVRQLRDYHDSLLDVQNILLCFKIVGDTKDAAAKTLMVQQMLTALVSRRGPVGMSGDVSSGDV